MLLYLWISYKNTTFIEFIYVTGNFFVNIYTSNISGIFVYIDLHFYKRIDSLDSPSISIVFGNISNKAWHKLSEFSILILISEF